MQANGFVHPPENTLFGGQSKTMPAKTMPDGIVEGKQVRQWTPPVSMHIFAKICSVYFN